MGSQRKAKKKLNREYFWDYNTVEQVLLSCGIFVCLSGVMFESDRFSDEGVAGAEDEPGKATFEWQREVIVYAVMIVVIFSFVFYFSVFLSEAMGITPKWIKKCFAKKHKTHIDKLIEMGHTGKRGSAVDLNINPMQKIALEQEAALAAVAASQMQISEIEEKNAVEREIQARQLATARKAAAKSGGRGKKSRNNKKKKVGQVGSSFDVAVAAGVGGAPKSSKSSKKKKGRSKSKDKSASSKSVDRQNTKRRPSYRAIKHEESGKEYYHNEDTGETQWDVPENADIIGRSPSTNVAKKRSSSFRAIKHEETGQEYYHNDETGETAWTLPEGAEVVVQNQEMQPSGGMGKKKLSFRAVKHEKSGQDYYHNEETGETAWTLPEGAEVL